MRQHKGVINIPKKSVFVYPHNPDTQGEGCSLMSHGLLTASGDGGVGGGDGGGSNGVGGDRGGGVKGDVGGSDGVRGKGRRIGSDGEDGSSIAEGEQYIKFV